MGMFDTVYCKYPLPEGFEEWHNEPLQTKSLDKQMEEYQIREDGGLYLYDAQWEWVDADTIFGKAMRPVPGTENWQQVMYHGDVEFYHYWSVNDKAGPEEQYGAEVRFTARFTNGYVTEIKAEKKEHYRPTKEVMDEQARRFDEIRATSHPRPAHGQLCVVYTWENTATFYKDLFFKPFDMVMVTQEVNREKVEEMMGFGEEIEVRTLVDERLVIYGFN